MLFAGGERTPKDSTSSGLGPGEITRSCYGPQPFCVTTYVQPTTGNKESYYKYGVYQNAILGEL